MSSFVVCGCLWRGSWENDLMDDLTNRCAGGERGVANAVGNVANNEF